MRYFTFIFCLGSLFLFGCASYQGRNDNGAHFLSIKDVKPGSIYEVGVYVVAKGDTIAKICSHFQMTVRDFEELNPELLDNSPHNGMHYIWVLGQQVRVYERIIQEGAISN